MEKDKRSISQSEAQKILKQIEKNIKKFGVDPQSTVKEMIRKKIFGNLVVDYLKAKKPASIKLTPTNIVVRSIPSGKRFNVRNDIDEILPTKDKSGMYGLIVDRKIEELFGDITLYDCVAVSGQVYEFNGDTTQKEMIFEGKHLAIYQEYHIIQALLLVNKLVKSGIFKKDGSIFALIFLKNRKNRKRYNLCLFLRNNGKFALEIHEASKNNKPWPDGCNVLFDY